MSARSSGRAGPDRQRGPLERRRLRHADDAHRDDLDIDVIERPAVVALVLRVEVRFDLLDVREAYGAVGDVRAQFEALSVIAALRDAQIVWR